MVTLLTYMYTVHVLLFITCTCIQTIFEVNPTSKGLAREVMKLKRDVHSNIVSAVREKRLQREECSSDICEGGRSDLADVNRKRCGQFSSEMEMSTEDDLKIFQTTTTKRKGQSRYLVTMTTKPLP